MLTFSRNDKLLITKTARNLRIIDTAAAAATDAREIDHILLFSSVINAVVRRRFRRRLLLDILHPSLHF